jgi:hypothetical protein
MATRSQHHHRSSNNDSSNNSTTSLQQKRLCNNRVLSRVHCHLYRLFFDPSSKKNSGGNVNATISIFFFFFAIFPGRKVPVACMGRPSRLAVAKGRGRNVTEKWHEKKIETPPHFGVLCYLVGTSCSRVAFYYLQEKEKSSRAYYGAVSCSRAAALQNGIDGCCCRSNSNVTTTRTYRKSSYAGKAATAIVLSIL